MGKNIRLSKERRQKQALEGRVSNEKPKSKKTLIRKTPWAISSTLERACDLLKLFTPQKPRWNVSELARQLNIPKSGVFRLVKTFERKHFLHSDDNSFAYEIGSGICELTGTVSGKRKRLVEIASPYLRDLNQMTGLLVSLRVLEHDEMVIVERVEGRDPVKIIFPVGTRQAINHGAPGKLLLAYKFPPDSPHFNELILRGKIARLTDKTMIDRRRLHEELTKIRRLGFAISDGEAIRGTIGVAAPVWSSSGHVEAALALTAVESLCDMKELLKYLPAIRRTAEIISRTLGYEPGKKSLGEVAALT